MATPTWPQQLPAPRIEGYGYQKADPNTRTAMDSGQNRVRRRFITTPTKVTARFRVTSAQLALFEEWFEKDTFSGQAWATLPVVNGLGKTLVLARFTEMPSVAGVDGSTSVFDVSGPFETLSMPGAASG